MRTLGMAESVTVPTMTVTGEELALVAGVFLECATDRADTAVNYAAYALAAAGCAETPTTLTTVAGHIPGAVVPNAVRTVRNLLCAKQFQEDRLRATLAQALDPAEVQVVRLEYADANFADAAWGVLSLHDVAPGRTAPLDWRRVRRDTEDEDGVLRDAVCDLIDFVDGRRRPPGAPAPLVALDQRLGGCPKIRAAVAERVPEHGLVVDARYARDRLVPAIYEQRRAVGGLSSSFGSWPLERPPEPVRIKQDGRSFQEYAVAFSDGFQRLYALVRPAGPTASLLTGRRRQERAAAIGETMAQLRPDMMARRLRIDAFRTASDDVWHRHTLLMSAMHDACSGILVPSETSVARICGALEQQV